MTRHEVKLFIRYVNQNWEKDRVAYLVKNTFIPAIKKQQHNPESLFIQEANSRIAPSLITYFREKGYSITTNEARAFINGWENVRKALKLVS